FALFHHCAISARIHRTRYAMPRCLLAVQNRLAVPADSHSGLHLLATYGALHRAHRDVRPLAFDAKRDRRPPVQIRNLAIRVPSRPHHIALCDQRLIIAAPPICRRRQLLCRRPCAGTNKNPVLLKVLEQVLGNVARGNRKRKPPVIAKIDCIASRRDHHKRIRLTLRACRDVIHAVRSRNVPVLIRYRRNGHRRCCVSFRLCLDQQITPPMYWPPRLRILESCLQVVSLPFGFWQIAYITPSKISSAREFHSFSRRVSRRLSAARPAAFGCRRAHSTARITQSHAVVVSGINSLFAPDNVKQCSYSPRDGYGPSAGTRTPSSTSTVRAYHSCGDP